MITILAVRNLVLRPWRTILLLSGFGLGVGVMITLLSIGDAMVAQARDERLVGGGEVTILPEGVDLELLKTGGVGGMWFSVANARFIYLQLLTSPRLRSDVAQAAPQIDSKLLYLRTPGGDEVPVRGVGDIPSLTRAVGAGPDIIAGTWSDDEADRRWRAPDAHELRHDIDHFHETPTGVANRESWAEWHYFNVLSSDRKRWAFLTFMLGGDVPHGRWGGQLLLTLHNEGREARRYSRAVDAARVRYSTTEADLVLADAAVRVLEDGRYAIRARIPSEQGGPPATVDLELTPEPQAWFPATSLGMGDIVFGYVVPGLRASASGTICEGTRCERYLDAQAYHDHNWGTWHGVTWEWGATRAGAFTVLYGRIISPDATNENTPLVVYLIDSSGFRAGFRPRAIRYVDGKTILVDGRPVRVPTRAMMTDANGADTLQLDLLIEDAVGTDTRRPLIERGEGMSARGIDRPYFIQMKGVARLRGRLDGKPIDGEGAGFFETYR